MLHIFLSFPSYGVVAIKNLPSAYLSEDEVMKDSEWLYRAPWVNVDKEIEELTGETYAEWFPFQNKLELENSLINGIKDKQDDLEHLTEMLRNIKNG